MEDNIQDENQRREFAIAKMGVEAILKEHMPRDLEIETAGAFFRKTSVAEGRMELDELEELGVDTSEMVDCNVGEGGVVASPGGAGRPRDYDNRKSPSGRRSPPPLQQVKEKKVIRATTSSSNSGSKKLELVIPYYLYIHNVAEVSTLKIGIVTTLLRKENYFLCL